MLRVIFAAAVAVSGLLLAGCTSTGTYVQTSGVAPPSVQIPNQYGQPVDLRQATSGPWTVVFFYPKANTPG